MYYIYVDEAWRWPIAWPVYVGLILEYVPDNKISRFEKGLFNKYKLYRDSKTIREDEREFLYDGIKENKNIIYSSWSSSSTEVDRNGIVRWVRWAVIRWMFKLMKWVVKEDFMKHGCYAKRAGYAIDFLKESWIKIVLDGKVDYGIRKALGIEVETIIKWDAKVPMISAASIVAKVERDREMRKHHAKFPHYGFADHKWYGTKKHYAAIEKYGMSPLHRKSFIHEIEEVQNS